MEAPQVDIEELRRDLERHTWQERQRTLGEYDQLLGISIYNVALDRLKEGPFRWLDMGCGEFRAGSDLIERLQAYYGEKSHPEIKATGVDLVTQVPDSTVIGQGVVIERADFITYPIPPDTDLVTCVFGLVQVNKYGYDLPLKAIQNWYNQLKVGGRLIFNTDELAGLNKYWTRALAILQDRLGRNIMHTYKLDTAREYRRNPTTTYRPTQQRTEVIDVTKKNSAPLDIVDFIKRSRF